MKFILPVLALAFGFAQASFAESSASMEPMCSFTNASDPNNCCHSHGCKSSENNHPCALTKCISQATAKNKDPHQVGVTSKGGGKQDTGEKAKNCDPASGLCTE